MKRYLLIILGMAFLLSSCASVSYFGDRYMPVKSDVEIYYSVHDVKKLYKVIGRLTSPNYDEDRLKAELKNYARTVGGNAVVINKPDVSNDGQSVSVTADVLRYADE
jgi:hypothetical protein